MKYRVSLDECLHPFKVFRLNHTDKSMIKNYTFADALRLGQVNALSVIQHIGTKNILLNERQARELMKNYKIKITVN